MKRVFTREPGGRRPHDPVRLGARIRRRLMPAVALGSLGAALLGSLSDAWAQWPPPPVFPSPPPGSTCVHIRRGGAGQVWDTDIGLGNGLTWAAGAYPYTWTGPSPYDHWTLYKYDLSPVPAGRQVVLAIMSTYVSWNDKSSVVRVHRIKTPWEELTANYQNWGNAANWDPAVIGTFKPSGVGHKMVDITDLVQGWHSGAVVNHGVLMEEDPVHLHAYFASESSTVNLRPSLYVCHVVGGPCAGKQNGDACDDGNACTTGETCDNGQCAGTQVACSPLDDCHEAGVCDPVTGSCTTPEKLDGSPCVDGDVCTTNDVCVSGLCMGGEAVSCSDGSACTSDVCVPGVGCVNQTLSCDDGNACTADVCDVTGGCEHQPITCDDGDVCTTDVCDPATGCGIAPISCDDGDACTVDGCNAQTGCTHSALSCNDGDLCTTDVCDPATGCDFPAVTCGQGDMCQPDLGCVPDPAWCDDSLACTADVNLGGGSCGHRIGCQPGQGCSPSFCATAAGQDPQYAWLCNP